MSPVPPAGLSPGDEHGCCLALGPALLPDRGRKEQLGPQKLCPASLMAKEAVGYSLAGCSEQPAARGRHPVSSSLNWQDSGRFPSVPTPPSCLPLSQTSTQLSGFSAGPPVAALHRDPTTQLPPLLSGSLGLRDPRLPGLWSAGTEGDVALRLGPGELGHVCCHALSPRPGGPGWGGAAGRSLVSPERGAGLRRDTHPFQRWSPSWERPSRDIPPLWSRDLN